jgi:hypothetical protein
MIEEKEKSNVSINKTQGKSALGVAIDNMDLYSGSAVQSPIVDCAGLRH